MTRQTLWSRRIFLQRMGYLSGLGVVGSRTGWSFSGEQAARGKAEPRFAYVGSWKHGIQVFSVQDRSWKLTQRIASNQPSAFVFHPTQRFLYAVNEIDEYQGLPTSTVEAYSVDASDGRLTLLNRRPLSLSAIGGRHLAVSPDGSHLIVAVHGGGSYNVLPIGGDGSLSRVSGILKEVGSGPDPARQNAAHPQMLLFDTTGRHVLSADLGSDRLNVFALTEGRLNVAHRRTTESGSGPRSLALHPAGGVLYVMNELDASISSFVYDANDGRILERLQHEPLGNAASSEDIVATAMTMHPSGNFLYAAVSRTGTGGAVDSSIAAWRVGRADGRIRLVRKMRHSSPIESLIPTDEHLFLLSRTEGICRFRIDPVSGVSGHAVRVADVSEARTMVFQGTANAGPSTPLRSGRDDKPIYERSFYGSKLDIMGRSS